MPRVIDDAEISNYFFFKIKGIITKTWAETQRLIQTLAFEHIHRGPPPSFWEGLNIQHPIKFRAQTVDSSQLPSNRDQSQLAEHLLQPQIEVYFRVLCLVYRSKSSNLVLALINLANYIQHPTFCKIQSSDSREHPATKREESKLAELQKLQSATSISKSRTVFRVL